MTDEEMKILQNTHDTVIELKTLIKGENGSGLISKVEKACDRQEKLEEKHNKLDGHFKLLVGILVGAGVLTGGGIGIAQLVQLF
jgi:hypothetical protein